jgi:hypothetical protein
MNEPRANEEIFGLFECETIKRERERESAVRAGSAKEQAKRYIMFMFADRA